ncbi:MAG: hypothetical protein QXL94_01530 [Candidatus Parvarchaeum sp.]
MSRKCGDFPVGEYISQESLYTFIPYSLMDFQRKSGQTDASYFLQLQNNLQSGNDAVQLQEFADKLKSVKFTEEKDALVFPDGSRVQKVIKSVFDPMRKKEIEVMVYE